MAKSIFLYVHGEDYSAMDFTRNYVAQEVYEDMMKCNEITRTIDTDETYMEIDILEFDEVDPKFVTFMKNRICDYDHLKAKDIYAVNEILA
jgi:hypothetical protein